MTSSETYVACLTPAGAGAIATIALRGPDAWSIARSLFHSPLPNEPTVNKFYLGRLGVEASTCDQVVVACKEHVCELHSHGGIQVVRLILELCAARGARLVNWLGDERICGIQSLARERLAHAPTLRTASILLDQMHGSFARAVEDVCLRIQNEDRSGAIARLGRLARTQHLGRHLVEPFRVVIAGPPNVGKSSFVNALAGYTRSLVSPLPGTTRDLVTTTIALEGWPIELTDTAGMRGSTNVLERAGIERARRILELADARLWMLDASSCDMGAPPVDWKFDGVILNKIDLITGSARERLLSNATTCAVSCVTGEGIQEACRAIAALLDRGVAPQPGEALAFTPELCDGVVAARHSLNEGDVPGAIAHLRRCLS